MQVVVLHPMIRVPSLKFVGLAVRKIWRTMSVSIFTLDLLTLRLYASRIKGRAEFGHARPLGYRIILYVCDGRTDGQKQRYCPLPSGGGIIIHYHRYLRSSLLRLSVLLHEICWPVRLTMLMRIR